MTADVATVTLADLAARANVEHAAYETTQAAAIAHAIAAGDALREAKQRVSHGEWLPWVAEHCDFTDRTASSYMRVAANRTRVSDLGSVREALAELATCRTLPSQHSVYLTPPPLRGYGSGPARDRRLASIQEESAPRGLFAWMVPWVAECPCCGTVEVYPRPVDPATALEEA